MRVAYLDCFAGIAGDMFLGALIDAGVPAAVLQEATAALNIGASLRIETVDRSGISATKVHVLEAGKLAEAAHSHHEAHVHSDEPLQQASQTATHSHQPHTQHRHKVHNTGHAHTHDHESQEPTHDHPQEPHEHTHVHGRSLTAIREIIQGAPLHEQVRRTAVRAFELLGHSEARIHNVPVDSIHFHEVGAVDAIVDIVAASAGIAHLQVGKWFASAVNVGGGMVQCAHGNFPVPAPATADLLRGFPTYSAHVQKELVTPTGAALLRALDPEFGPQPGMKVEKIGYGAGSRNPGGFPNVLRLSVGEAQHDSDRVAHTHTATDRTATNTVTVLETALDDLSPQVIAYAAERVLAQGALDVMLTPVIMKKGRPGTLLTVLCNPADTPALQEVLLRETSTLGVRIRQERRACLNRELHEVDTVYGPIRIKVGSAAGEERNVAPEFEDCRVAANRHGVPLKIVQQTALAAYRERV